MRILVTGASGFIGQHVVSMLLQHGHKVIATGRSEEKVSDFPWYREVEFVSYDIQKPDNEIPQPFIQCDAVIHLAWQGVRDYDSLYHFEENVLASYRFLKTLMEAGVGHLQVAGTCLEYGMQCGCLSEDMPAFPVNSYAMAKDTLRKFLQALQNARPYVLQWTRLFYMYGPGQNPNCLLAQLDRAIDKGETVFNMSGGEQLRDYLPIEEVARRLVVLIEHPEVQGIINCCNGTPTSVRQLVEKHIANRGSGIRLNLGYYPYPDYEPMAFWGNSDKLDQLSRL